jgi:cyclin-A
MADKENCMRVTRLAKKRAAESMAVAAEQQRPSKKRVVLGELKNFSSNISSSRTKDLTSQPQKRQKYKNTRKAKEGLEGRERKAEDAGIDVVSESDDPQMCVAYVSEIYEYLHRMEVS